MNDAVSVPLIGQTVTVLDTPALIVDLDVLEANIARIAGLCRDHGVNWRPHVKGNKTVEIVRKELAAGAIGITCAKVGEAEVMVAAGVRSILIRGHRRAARPHRRRSTDRQTARSGEPARRSPERRPDGRCSDMGAGAGYSTELMARSVGPTGKVYGQNDADSEKLRARMTTPVMRNVVALVRPSDDPVPADLHDLDLITFYFAYHDTTYMQIDRAKMDKAMFAALKPGGIPGHRGPFGSAGRWRHRGQDLSSDCRADVARGGRGGGIRVRCRRRFPAPSGRRSHGHRLPQPYAGGRVRAEVPQADVSLLLASRRIIDYKIARKKRREGGLPCSIARQPQSRSPSC